MDTENTRPRDVAEVIRQAEPKATALVHLGPEWTDIEEAAEAVRRRVSGAEVVACSDGTVLSQKDSAENLLGSRSAGALPHSIVPGGLLEMS